MKIEEFYKLENIIEKILEDDIETRKSDMFLYYEYCRKVNPKTDCITFTRYFIDKELRKEHKIREFESVRRVRQKIQAKRPELKDKETAEARTEESLNYEKYDLN